MTTTMRLPLSTGRRRVRARNTEHDDGRVFECRRPEFLPQRALAMGGILADRHARSPISLHVGLLPDDVVDAPLHERLLIGEVHRVAETEHWALWYFTP